MMFDPPSYGGHTIDTGYADSQERNVAGLPMTTWDDFELAIDQGFDIIHMGDGVNRNSIAKPHAKWSSVQPGA